MKFYKCPTCGKIVAVIENDCCPTVCCGAPMKEIVAGTVDAAREKHIPVYTVEGNVVTVTVGSVEHPMTEAHLINWVLLVTNKGNQRKVLTANQKPTCQFALLEGEEVVEVYAYCNLHGLWKA